MTIVGSYANGFAPRDSQPLYPELWTDCDGVWAPCLGPSGEYVHDWSGNDNHGVLTNTTLSTVWSPAYGVYSLLMDGNNDYITFSSRTYALPFSVSCWVKFTGTGTMILAEGGSGQSQLFVSSGNVFMGVRDNASAQITGPLINTGQWTHVTAVWLSATSRSLYVNGAIAGTGTASVSTSLFLSRFASRIGDSLFFGGSINTIAVHTKALTASEAKLMSMSPNVMFSRAPRRRSRIFTGGFRAYWAARKAQIIGGGL